MRTVYENRLLLYDLRIVHTPGRTLGMADYFSRHPSQCKGSIIQSEEMFKEWFTVNVVDEFTNGLKQTVLAKKERNNQNARKFEQYGEYTSTDSGE